MKKLDKFIYLIALIITIITLLLPNILSITVTTQDINVLVREVINRSLMYPAREEIISLLLKLNHDFAVQFDSIYKPSNWEIFYENIYTLISVYIHSFHLTPYNVDSQTASDSYTMLLSYHDHVYNKEVNELITKTLSNLFSTHNMPTELLDYLQKDSNNEKYKPLWDSLII